MKMVLFQPRYPYGKRAVYLSGGLMNLGSRLITAGVNVTFFDLNLIDLDSKPVLDALKTAGGVGFSVIGPPYIPIIRENIDTLRALGFEKTILLGGQGIERVHPGDFHRLFRSSHSVVQIEGESDILIACRLGAIRSMYDISMVPMLERLDETLRFRYLSQEFALFLSQGCKFGCKFCAAAKAQRETYRTVRSLSEEIDYICRFLASRGHRTLAVYLTNLDALQNPDELEERLRTVWETARRYGVTVHARALATSQCTVEATCPNAERPHADPALLRRLRSYGLRVVGFGADGGNEEALKRQQKGHNKLSELEEARLAMQAAGIEVEMLIVLGFQGDKPSWLWDSFKFGLRAARAGCFIRPYLAKMSPSGDWPEGNPQVEAFLTDPSLLHRIDYTAIASKHTHPDWRERWRANLVYLGLITLLVPFGRCRTFPLFPVPKRGLGNWFFSMINRLMPFDK